VRGGGGWQDGEGYLSIGGAEWDPFQGMLDDVRVWDHARDAAQIRRDMVMPPEADDAGLVGHWQFDEGTGLVRASAFFPTELTPHPSVRTI